MVISGQIFSPATLDTIRGFISGNQNCSRSDVARFVCSELDWVDPLGRPKFASCKKAMLKLEKQGFINLPNPKRKMNMVVSRLEEHDFIPPPISGELKQLPRLKVDLVTSKADRELWLHLVKKYHYIGKFRVVGPQVKYLIRHDDQVLGALCFSSGAWSVKARDEWIGWSACERQQGLSHVLNNSRFLILPTVHVKNLASKVLSLTVKRLPSDWLAAYGNEPRLLETFVDESRFKGTCYIAANWQDIGLTSGRGRNDQLKPSCGDGPKRIFIYPLKKHQLLKSELPISPELATFSRPRPIRNLLKGPVHQGVDWAENEFGTVDLGDPRLNRRLLTIARDFADAPNVSLPEACGGDWAKTRAAYRFLDNPSVNLNNLLQPHVEASLRRCSEEKVVLAAQDTTSLNYVSHPGKEGMGPIASKKTGAVGLMVHDTLLINEEGTPLGLLDVQSWARPDDAGQTKDKKSESDKWFHSYEKLCEAQKLLPRTRFISVGDREADIYGLFAKALEDEDNPHLLVRMKNNRKVIGEIGDLWGQLSAEDSVGNIDVSVAKKKGGHPARTATLEVRVRLVNIKAPATSDRNLPKTLDLWAVFAKEVDTPAGATPLEWMLLTTCPVQSGSAAQKILKYYGLRWQIEVFHRTLKTGCGIEERLSGDRSSIESCLAIDFVVAWRVFYLVKLGRETPDISCEVFFKEHEWKALVVRTTRAHPKSNEPPRLYDALRMVAALGGFLGRKSDGHPGPKAAWKGLEKLDQCVDMYLIMTGLSRPPGENEGEGVRCG
jgi:hypothetical protein